MTTITKEWLQKTITSIESARDEIPFGLDEDQSNMLTAFKIALVSLEAKPIGAFHIAEQQVDGTSDYIKDGEWPIDNGTIEVYAASPVPVVPEEKPMPNPLSMYAVDAVAAIAEVRGWNACRAAMLHGAEPVSQTYKLNELSGNSPVIPDGWISCNERMPEDGQHVIILCDGAFVLYAQYRDGEFFDVVRNGEEFFETQSRNVTHWMPLPEPPQEVK
ncbi:DUF551 domain-containing protein [Escherichia coli]|nr:DUF551 domain-containing protein [Escherichia coli]